ncbi:hypothetical protein H0H81_006043 [Sphagnurus paluster]|uniref:F-box domain-containing protein n=1 Tax=Sphagnurus paluster TaxID=117069 RepID=A0A9P7GPA2_9AGAR|nr:hypothetical protein H0H81_006043 [Sphagnurus paluster]
MATLPRELILSIFEDLKCHPTALKTCALVCRDWTTPSQAHIFHTIILDIDIKCLALHNLLLSSPHIAPLIRDLSVITEDDVPEVILDEEASLAAAILLLNKVQSLTLHMGWRMHWHKLSLDLRNAIIKLLKLSSLTDLTMGNWFFDFSDIDLHNIFRHAVALKRLTLTGPSCPTSWTPCDDAFLEGLPGQRTCLEELKLGLEYGTFGIGEWFCRPLCALDLRRLRSLHVMYTGDNALVSQLLDVIGESLERLHFEVEAC